MDEGIIHGLPPSKRFKFLQQNCRQSPLEEISIHLCLPAKKRIESRSLPTPICLPAKKRIWALTPLQQGAIQEIEDSPSKQNTHDVTLNHESRIKDEERDAAHHEEDDDGIVCAVCQSTDGAPSDPIVFCDGCDLTVHASCYGEPLVDDVPEGDWFCARCLSEKKKILSGGDFGCCLCPSKRGAIKPTVDGRWAHIICAILVPEVFFRDWRGREGIDCSLVPRFRRTGVCYICDGGEGCLIDCSEPKCGCRFHVSCGLKEALCLELTEEKGTGIVVGFCNVHTDLWKKQQSMGKFKIVPRNEK